MAHWDRVNRSLDEADEWRTRNQAAAERQRKTDGSHSLCIPLERIGDMALADRRLCRYRPALGAGVYDFDAIR